MMLRHHCQIPHSIYLLLGDGLIAWPPNQCEPSMLHQQLLTAAASGATPTASLALQGELLEDSELSECSLSSWGSRALLWPGSPLLSVSSSEVNDTSTTPGVTAPADRCFRLCSN